MARSSVPWWSRKSTEPPHLKLISLITEIRSKQATRYNNIRRFVECYEYANFDGVLGMSNAIQPIQAERLKFNIAKNAIDTMHALLMAPKVAPMLLTDGGNWTQRNRAKEATQALEGLFAEQHFDDAEEDIVRDGLVAGCGFLREHAVLDVDEMTAEIRLSRLLPEDVVVDEAEGRYMRPPCIYVRTMVDRYKLLDEYGGPDKDLYGSANDRRTAIRKVAAGHICADDSPSPEATNEDQVEVWEAWHLPSGCDADDGRYTVAIQNATLYDVEWERESFPVAVYRPTKAHRGFWGLTEMRDAMGAQREYAKVTEKLQRAHKKMGGSHFIVSKGAANPRAITSDQGTIVEVNDINAIKDFQPTPANPQTYQYRENIADDLIRYMGLSTQTSRMEVPTGLDGASGKALQSFQDTESKRLVLKHRARERFVCDVASIVLESAAALIKAGYTIKTRYPDKHGYNDLDWKDFVDIVSDKRKYMVRVFPVGMLSQTPSAKFAQVDALLQRQVITVEQFKRLIGLPDFEAESDVDCADYEIIDKNLDTIAAKGERIVVQPFDDFKAIIERGAKFYNYLRRCGCPENRLELVRQYIEDAQHFLQDTAPPPAPPMPAMPPGAPMMGAPPNPMGGPPMPPPGPGMPQ